MKTGAHRRSPDSSLIGIVSLQGCMTLYETFKRSVRQHPGRPCLGHRSVDSFGAPGPFLFRTYSQCATTVHNFASGLAKEDILGRNSENLKLLGIYMKNCPAWSLAEYACYSMNAATVPLYDTLGPDTVEFVLNQTELMACLCSTSELVDLLKVSSKCPNLKTIIVNAKSIPPAKMEEYAKLYDTDRIQILTFDHVVNVGRAFPSNPTPPTPDSLATFCYTSGTTGQPKGALITHQNIVSVANSALSSCFDVRYDDYYLSFLPLPHIFERMVVSALLSSGSAIGFYRGDPLKLIEDCVALRPTIFCAVPRLLNKIYDKVMGGITSDDSGLKGKMARTAIHSKLNNLHKQGKLSHWLWDPLLFSKIKSAIGMDKVRRLVSGGAPLSSHTMDFFRILLGAKSSVHEGYGLTETTGGVSLTLTDDLSAAGHVGGPLPVCEVCLADVPDMGYFHTDAIHDESQRCDGRGEILVRGPGVFKGYYKNEEATREAITEDGWLRTGDIGLWQPDGQLQIIDRKKNLLKLSQGEYVAVEKVENVLGRSSIVNQVFVHGSPLESCVVAVVVPDPAAIESKSTAEVRNEILKDFLVIGKEAGLKGFEIPKNVHIDKQIGEWSPSTGLVTPTMKIKRAQLRDKYKSELQLLYKDLSLSRNNNGSNNIVSKL